MGHALIRAPQVGASDAAAVVIAAPAPCAPISHTPGALTGAEHLGGVAEDASLILERARQQGFNEGFEAGRQEGLAAAQREAESTLGRIRDLVARAAQEHASFYRLAERQVIDLAMEIARKVVEREVENVPDLAVGVIQSALEEMDGHTIVRVRVSPEDAELVKRRWEAVLPPSISPERVELTVDPRVKGGGAIIETTQGQVDAQLDEKLAQLASALWSFSAADDAGVGDAGDA